MHYFYSARLTGEKLFHRDVNEVKISVGCGNSWDPRALIDNEREREKKRWLLF